MADRLARTTTRCFLPQQADCALRRKGERPLKAAPRAVKTGRPVTTPKIEIETETETAAETETETETAAEAEAEAEAASETATATEMALQDADCGPTGRGIIVHGAQRTTDEVPLTATKRHLPPDAAPRLPCVAQTTSMTTAGAETHADERTICRLA